MIKPTHNPRRPQPQPHNRNRGSDWEPTNISNPYGYQSNGKKKNRDVTPI